MRFGISEKIVCLFVLLIISLEAFTGFYFIQHEKNTLLEEFDQRAKALIQSLVVSVEYPVLVGDNERLDVLGNGVMQQTDIVFCQIKDKQGRILFEAGSPSNKRVRAHSSPIRTLRAAAAPGEELLLGPAKREFEDIGKVTLYFSLTDLQNKLNAAKTTITVFVLTGTIVALFFIVLLTKFVLSKPISELLTGIQRISSGDLHHKVAVKSQDEIGQLADSFNSMTEDLKDLMQRDRELAAEAVTANFERKRAEELEKAYNELERANTELNDFAYIVSHDLKAPLRGIKTLASWMSTDYAEKFDDAGREQMSLLLNRVDRMHNLIDGILQYSRVGRVKAEKVKVDLSELVPDIIDMIAAPEHISVSIEDEMPVVEFERTRIAQVFQNLLSNAVKYMDKPQGVIRIGCVAEDGFWKFSIADNGPGIEEKYFEKIFRIFQTLAPRDEFESTGVGLSLVKKIVETYGGRIWVESKPGEGSTFLFTLLKTGERVKDAKLETGVVSRR
jgi:signal transduction histidine kinase